MKASDAIRTAMALKKLKQHELAALIGVSQQMVSEWETEKETVAVKNWEALKQILDVDCAVLEMPQTSVSNQTATVNARQQSHSGSGTVAMFGQDGIVIAGRTLMNAYECDCITWIAEVLGTMEYPALNHVSLLINRANHDCPGRTSHRKTGYFTRLFA